MPIIIGSTSAGTLGTVTLGELKSLVQAEGYDTDTTAQQTLFARAVLRELYGERRWNFLTSVSTSLSATVANGGMVDISSLGRGIKIDTVRLSLGTDYSGDDNLDPVDVRVLRDNRFTDRQPGYPRQWARMIDTLLFWPIPDNTYPLDIQYTALTTLPTSDGDTVLWPETHMDVLVYGIVKRLCRRQRDWNGFDRATQDFDAAKARLMRSDSDEDSRQGSGDQVQRWKGWDKLI